MFRPLFASHQLGRHAYPWQSYVRMLVGEECRLAVLQSTWISLEELKDAVLFEPDVIIRWAMGDVLEGQAEIYDWVHGAGFVDASAPMIFIEPADASIILEQDRLLLEPRQMYRLVLRLAVNS